MRVVSRGSSPEAWPRHFTCPHCTSVLELGMDDIKRNSDYLGEFTSWWVTCPVCLETPDVPRTWWWLLNREKKAR